MVLVRVGSGDESTGLSGISHWVEHMNFKGTERIARPDEGAGGAVRRHERLHLDRPDHMRETAASAALDQMIFLEAERMA